jgi:hypothetical protein
MFFSIVLGESSTSGAERQVVTLRIPHAIDEVEARWNKRIRSFGETGFKAIVRKENSQEIHAAVMDIGRGGTDLNLDVDALDTFGIGEPVSIRFLFDGMDVSLAAELRWRNGTRHGFCFSHYHDKTVYVTPAELESLLGKIEEAADNFAA